MLNATIQTTADLLRITRKELQRLDNDFRRAMRISRKFEERSRRRIEKAAQKMEAKRLALEGPKDVR
jgi:vacuolar-type H+-ATPase subunit E/Vma4